SLFSYVYCCFFFQCYLIPRDLHSFPTRRSSDLGTMRRSRSPDVMASFTPFSSGSVAMPFSSTVSSSTSEMARPKRWPFKASASEDRKSTRLNSSHVSISYAVFCLKKKKNKNKITIYYNTTWKQYTHTNCLQYSVLSLTLIFLSIH